MFDLRVADSDSANTLYLSDELDASTRHLVACCSSSFVSRCVVARDHAAADPANPDGVSRCGAAVLDTAGITLIDAAGVGVIVELRNSLADAGVRLSTNRPSPQFRRMSTLCRLDAFLGIDLLDTAL